MDFWWDIGLPAAVVILVMAAFSTPIIGVAAWVSSAACSSQASKMELEHSWGMLQNCMVRVDGKWMLLDSYKVVRLRP